MDIHQKCLVRQLVAVASMCCSCHTDHNCHNKHSVADVAHDEQEVATDWWDLQDGVDDDDDVVP